jgi:hypothetical protein
MPSFDPWSPDLADHMWREHGQIQMSPWLRDALEASRIEHKCMTKLINKLAEEKEKKMNMRMFCVLCDGEECQKQLLQEVRRLGADSVGFKHGPHYYHFLYNEREGKVNVVRDIGTMGVRVVPITQLSRVKLVNSSHFELED